MHMQMMLSEHDKGNESFSSIAERYNGACNNVDNCKLAAGQNLGDSMSNVQKYEWAAGFSHPNVSRSKTNIAAVVNSLPPNMRVGVQCHIHVRPQNPAALVSW